jgi:hypothetical protein
MGLRARVRARLRGNEHAADGVWEPRRKDSFLGSGDHHGPPDDDFLKPRVK